MENRLNYETRRGLWKAQPREARKMIVQGSIESLLSCEPDISTEQLIQRIVDTFGCDHHEVMMAIMAFSEVAVEA